MRTTPTARPYASGPLGDRRRPRTPASFTAGVYEACSGPQEIHCRRVGLGRCRVPLGNHLELSGPRTMARTPRRDARLGDDPISGARIVMTLLSALPGVRDERSIHEDPLAAAREMVERFVHFDRRLSPAL